MRLMVQWATQRDSIREMGKGQMRARRTEVARPAQATSAAQMPHAAELDHCMMSVSAANAR